MKEKAQSEVQPLTEQDGILTVTAPGYNRGGMACDATHALHVIVRGPSGPQLVSSSGPRSYTFQVVDVLYIVERMTLSLPNRVERDATIIWQQG